MAIQVVCDNCGKALRDKPDEANANNTDWKPDKHVVLKMHIEDTESYPVLMDLCVRCAQKYIKVLKQPF